MFPLKVGTAGCGALPLEERCAALPPTSGGGTGGSCGGLHALWVGPVRAPLSRPGCARLPPRLASPIGCVRACSPAAAADNFLFVLLDFSKCTFYIPMSLVRAVPDGGICAGHGDLLSPPLSPELPSRLASDQVCLWGFDHRMRQQRNSRRNTRKKWGS